MNTQNESFTVAYDGPALVDHQMDVKELAPALLSIGELIEEVNQIINPSHVRIAVNIKATKEGSVHIDLVAVQSLLEQARGLFAGQTVTAISNANTILMIIFGGARYSYKGVVALIKWINGRKIQSVTKLENGDFNIILEGGEMTVTNETELTIFRTISVRKKIETFVKKPLLATGVNQLRIITSDTEEIINKSDAESFSTPVEDVTDEKEMVSEMTLQLISIAFQGDYKWRFSDGMSSFTADMLDQDFRQKVERSELAFAKDDIFTARVKTRQFIAGGELKSERSILQVLDYRSGAATRMRLPGI